MKLDDLEMSMLAEACGLLQKIASKPDPAPPPPPVVKVSAPFIPAPIVNVPAPVVNVPAPIVNVPAAPKPFSEWKFVITDSKGNKKTIVATAIK